MLNTSLFKKKFETRLYITVLSKFLKWSLRNTCHMDMLSLLNMKLCQ